MKKFMIPLIVILVLGILSFVWATSSANKALANIEYESIDMQLVADGSYVGACDAGLVVVKIAASIHNHELVDIQILEHQNGLGEKAAVIVDEMLSRNRYDVDAIAGATLSSEAIKSAVSKALKQGY